MQKSVSNINQNMKVALFVLSAVVCTLGAPSDGLGWRIVGGGPASEGQFPYQISLRFRGSHSCGGSIIDATTILCAAHCVDGRTASDMTVVTGTNKLNKGGDEYKVASFVAHEKYNWLMIQNDISLIKLKEPIQFNEKVQPVELMKEDIGGGEDCILSGWGTTSYPGSAPNDLQWIQLKTLSVDECAVKQSNTVGSQVCTLTKAGEGACHGDSGGPLVSGGKQIGIVSWGNPCARGRPDVFTRVSSFIDWIEKNR